MHNPSKEHLKAAKRILKYLNGTINQGLHLKGNENLEIKCYSDAD